jgi:hypothetical protein
MCLFKQNKGKTTFTPGVKPVQDTDTALPEVKDLRPDKEVDTDITYGKGRKEQQQQQAQGARSLAINLPNATQPGAQTGGLNSNQNQL